MKYSRGDSTVNQNSWWHVTEHLEKSIICYIAAGLWDILSVELSHCLKLSNTPEPRSRNECCSNLNLLQEGPVTAQLGNETGKWRKEKKKKHLRTSEFKNSSYSHNLIWHSAVCEKCGRVCHVTLFLSEWYCTVWMYNNIQNLQHLKAKWLTNCSHVTSVIATFIIATSQKCLFLFFLDLL